jgi:hypothetical protein
VASEEVLKELDLPIPDNETLSTVEEYSSKVHLIFCLDTVKQIVQLVDG